MVVLYVAVQVLYLNLFVLEAGAAAHDARRRAGRRRTLLAHVCVRVCVRVCKGVVVGVVCCVQRWQHARHRQHAHRTRLAS